MPHWEENGRILKDKERYGKEDGKILKDKERYVREDGKIRTAV